MSSTLGGMGGGGGGGAARTGNVGDAVCCVSALEEFSQKLSSSGRGAVCLFAAVAHAGYVIKGDA